MKLKNNSYPKALLLSSLVKGLSLNIFHIYMKLKNRLTEFHKNYCDYSLQLSCIFLSIIILFYHNINLRVHLFWVENFPQTVG